MAKIADTIPVMTDAFVSTCPEAFIEERAQKLKAVGHPIRLKLLCMIARGQDSCVSDLWRCLNQPQPVISQHLSILKEYGIVGAEVQKTRRVYSIVDPFIRDLVQSVLADIDNQA